MATDKTQTVSGRVPTAVAEALADDAAFLGVSPGTLIRQILEGRYSAPRGVAKAHKRVGNADDEAVTLDD